MSLTIKDIPAEHIKVVVDFLKDYSTKIETELRIAGITAKPEEGFSDPSRWNVDSKGKYFDSETALEVASHRCGVMMAAIRLEEASNKQ